MKRKMQETFEVDSGSAYKKQRTAFNHGYYGTEDPHSYSLLDPIPVTSSVPLYFAESRFSPAFRTFQAFYNSDYSYDETEFYFVQQQNYVDDCCTYESPRLGAEQYTSYNNLEQCITLPDYSTRSSQMQSLQNQNQVIAQSNFAGKRAEDKESYKTVVIPSSYEVDSPLPSPTHMSTSDVSHPTQKKPLSKVPDPNVIKQLRELIDAQKIFQKDISAKLGVSPSTLSLYMNSKARTNGWSALERKICDIMQELIHEEGAQSPKSDRSPVGVSSQYGARGSSNEQYDD